MKDLMTKHRELERDHQIGVYLMKEHGQKHDMPSESFVDFGDYRPTTTNSNA